MELEVDLGRDWFSMELEVDLGREWQVEKISMDLLSEQREGCPWKIFFFEEGFETCVYLVVHFLGMK
jgi:hypothetical protein